MSTAAPPSGDTSQLSILPQLREVRLPEKHALVMNPIEEREGPSPNKKPRLTILPQQQQIPVNSMINQRELKQMEPILNQTRLNQTTGGIVTVSKAPVQSVHHHGGKFFLKLLGIASRNSDLQFLKNC